MTVAADEFNSATSPASAAHAPKPLGVALVGAGMVAELHHRALVEIPDRWHLRGIVEPDATLAVRRCNQWSTRHYPNLDAALGDEGVDAVLVLAPYATHQAIAMACLAAGKHVLVEKPVADPDAVDRLASAAERVGKICMPGHNYAYQPEFRQLRRLVRNGALGTVRAVFITYAIAHPEEVAAHYDGVLAEVMIHHTYLSLALLGTPERVWAGRTRPSWQHHLGEDQAWMTWDYAGQTTAHLFASFAVGDDSADPWTFVVKALGTNGSASYTWRSMTYRRPLGTLPIAIPAYEDSYVHELTAFADAIAGRPEAIISPLADAARAGRLIAYAETLADASPPSLPRLD